MGCVCRPQTNLHPKSLVQHIQKEGKVFSIVFSLKDMYVFGHVPGAREIGSVPVFVAF